ncbi:MAG: helix-turn-helix domain-containing protein [Bacillota bacterium]
MTFADRLRQLREQRGLLREEVAERLQLSYWTIAKYESGSRSPSGRALAGLARILGVSVDYLLGTGDEDRSATNVSPEPDLIRRALERPDLCRIVELLSPLDDYTLHKAIQVLRALIDSDPNTVRR